MNVNASNSTLACIQAAALQCFILLIAAKRADQIAAQIALHTLQNTESIKQLIEQNTALTEQVAALTRALHDHMLTTAPTVPDPAAPEPVGAGVARRSRSPQQQRQRIRT